MDDITTAYKGFGSDRMTPIYNMNKAINLIFRQFYVFWKYKRFFLKYPSSAIQRFKKIIFVIPKSMKQSKFNQ